MKSKMQFILSMSIFGTSGIIVRHIDLATSEIALLRGLIGSLFLATVIFSMKQKISWAAIRENGLIILVSSIALGANWIFLFEAYKHTTIANAALSYYFAPVFVMLLSPLILKEKLSPGRFFCVCVAMLGMVLIVDNGRHRTVEYNHLLGIAYGLIAAAFYASLMLLNKFMKNLNGLETTLIQLATASFVLMPYVLLTEGFKIFHTSGSSMAFILLLGIVHTGVGFFLFFSGIQGLKGQTIAVLSYVDPITSLVTAVLVLRERMTAMQLLGGALLLGSTFVSASGLTAKVFLWRRQEM
jgi:RarD protein